MMICKMTVEDINAVFKIEADSFSMPWSETSFKESLLREDTLFLVAKEGDEIFGYIGMYFSFDEGEITNVAVSKEWRKQGIGKKLLESIKEAGREQNLSKIFLEVRVSNEGARALYYGSGFKELGIRKNFYERPREDAILMACEI